MKILNLTGNRYGYLVVQHRAANMAGSQELQWRCKCDCGAQRVVAGVYLRRNRIYGCVRCQQASSGAQA